MKTPAFIKALLLSSALFTMVAPAYAGAAPYITLSNEITATFKVNAPEEPTYMLSWINSSGAEVNVLPTQEVNAGEEKELTLRATVSQNYDNIRYEFNITRTEDNTYVETNDDVTVYQMINNEAVKLNGFTQNGVFYASSNKLATVTSPSMDTAFKVVFNKAGSYKIEAAAYQEEAR